jgi:hypothetical protein
VQLCPKFTLLAFLCLFPSTVLWHQLLSTAKEETTGW